MIRRTRLSRRDLFRGTGAVVVAGGAGALLAACGGGGGDDATSATTTVGAGDATLNLLSAFDVNGAGLRVGAPARLTYTLADFEGVPLREIPAEATFTIGVDDGEGGIRPIGEPITVRAHAEGIPIPYYPVRFTPETEGVHAAGVTISGQPLAASFLVPATSAVPGIGDPLPATTTATTADPMGVDPVCTRPEPCGFHEVSLDDALGAAGPTVLVVSTPAFCQTGLCGPTLDLLVDLDLDPARVVHVEVYADATEVGVFDATSVPVIGELGLSYEPSLFVADADGRVVERLDNLWDRAELTAALALVGL
ncbi:MAG TPA: hypothetical protein VK866_12860 [Acidimicrobiales bacterium]|nr:hypothetical protein [Acidimicrobiales bacterium]